MSMLVAAAAACEAEDPQVKNPIGSGGGGNVSVCDADVGIEDVSGPSCAPLSDDYTPRESGSANDTWPACISDGNTYVKFDENISSLARVAAFEQIGVLLGFGGKKAPSPQDFLDARVLYSEEQGIESRVSRREDEHYPAAPMLCRDMTPEEQAKYPDRCVGPVKIRPILNAAFEAGIAGEDVVENAARIEGALLWFFYVSIYKEATSSAQNALDVDSMWAKYTGGEPRESSFGLSRYVVPRSREAHDRIWDGLLAVRCWRDLDNPTGVAMDLAMQQRARAQLDRALLRGMALITRQRALALPCAPAWETVKILATVLDREAEARDPAQAAALRAETQKTNADDVDKTKLVTALDALFPCP
jgi:hypothetical protein